MLLDAGYEPFDLESQLRPALHAVKAVIDTISPPPPRWQTTCAESSN